MRQRNWSMHEQLWLMWTARCLTWSWLCLMAGCQTSSVPLAEGVRADSYCARGGTLFKQIAMDSTVEMATHPLRSSVSLLHESADGFCAASQGVFGKRIGLRLIGAPGPLPPDSCRHTVLSGDPPYTVPECGLEPVHMCLYPEGQDALRALCAVIDSATCRIDVLMFIWDNDQVGREIASHLAERARAGVPVRILLDGGGNLIYGEFHNPPEPEINQVVRCLAQQPNIQVLRTRNPFARFDHRKLVVADGRVAWTGGRNFKDNAFFDKHDLSFTLTGPLATKLSATFEKSWQDQGGKPAPRLPDSELAGEANAWARLVATEPFRHDLADAIFSAADHAQHHIYLENPYISDSRLLLKLARARRRGVDVRVVLSLQASASVVTHSNRVTANRLLKAGVRVYLYPGTLHQKAMAVDGCWVYLGTGNFDPLSLRHDLELGLVIGKGSVIHDVEHRLFQQDFQPDWELKEPLPLSCKDYISEMLASFCL